MWPLTSHYKEQKNSFTSRMLQVFAIVFAFFLSHNLIVTYSDTSSALSLCFHYCLLSPFPLSGGSQDVQLHITKLSQWVSRLFVDHSVGNLPSGEKLNHHVNRIMSWKSSE